jgi:hypothetical protein
VIVLGRKGFTVAVKGTNGFLCIVERSWGASTDDPDFWNPKVRSPICFNPAGARSYAPIFLMKFQDFYPMHIPRRTVVDGRLPPRTTFASEKRSKQKGR